LLGIILLDDDHKKKKKEKKEDIVFGSVRFFSNESSREFFRIFFVSYDLGQRVFLQASIFLHPLDEDATTHLPLNSFFNFRINSNKHPFLKVE